MREMHGSFDKTEKLILNWKRNIQEVVVIEEESGASSF